MVEMITLSKDEYAKLRERVEQLDTEIADRQRVETALRESEERYRRIVNAATNYTYSVALEQGRAVSTRHSAGCLALTGYTPEDYAADPGLWYSMVHDEDRHIVDAMLQKLFTSRDIAPIEHRLRRRDGKVIWVRNTIAPYRDGNGVLLRYDGMIENITERKEKEAEISRLNETLEQRVKERTAEMEAMLKSYVDRELRMAELKGKITELERKSVKATGYEDR